ncbi:hypothetical protein EVAR_59642_1 [Eumeta japonica]|uniref:Uncharacterized protein n=1 Tax=Eumeta variegata TaxID=151549 RepID=A0A4C1YK28_EUMVA|nr:hypothetical protein EVAR_59642_1 [Eumeta japonica]
MSVRARAATKREDGTSSASSSTRTIRLHYLVKSVQSFVRSDGVQMGFVSEGASLKFEMRYSLKAMALGGDIARLCCRCLSSTRTHRPMEWKRDRHVTSRTLKPIVPLYRLFRALARTLRRNVTMNHAFSDKSALRTDFETKLTCSVWIRRRRCDTRDDEVQVKMWKLFQRTIVHFVLRALGNRLDLCNRIQP